MEKNKSRAFSRLSLCSLIVVMLVAFASCEKEEGPRFDTPSITLGVDAVVNAKVGTKVSVPLTFQADGGAKSLVVYKSGGFLKEIPLDANASQYTYETDALPSTLAEGEETHYAFLLSNLDNNDSEQVEVTIKAELYDKITVGTTSLYEIELPAEGIVSPGTVINLIQGRNYYLSSSLTFEAGSTLVIEEGVHVYMNADADNAINLYISGEADIKGTANNPVVFTSSRTLLSGVEAEAGDWNSFRLTGTGNESTNGTVNYLRMEYAGDRAFRLINVGARTNISHVQVFKATTEGVMITDGNARLKYIVVTDSEGGSYRLGDNYEGFMQFVISSSSQYFGELDDVAIRETSKPIIANATFLGAGTDTQNTHGLRIRAASAPKIYNTIVAEFRRRGVRVVDDVQITDLNGPAVFAYSYVFAVPTDPYRDMGVSFAGTFDGDGNPLQNTFHNNVTKKVGNSYTLTEVPGIGVEAFVPAAEQTSAFNPSTINEFFTNAPFAGAIKNSTEDWTKGWVKNSDGTVR